MRRSRAAEGAPVIGFLSSRSPEDSWPKWLAFGKALPRWVTPRARIWWSSTVRGAWRLRAVPALAADLVGKPVGVLATVGGEPSALAAKGATSTIPIVFSMGDPVQLGLAESYNRPGRNITGIDIMGATELETKQIGNFDRSRWYVGGQKNICCPTIRARIGYHEAA